MYGAAVTLYVSRSWPVWLSRFSIATANEGVQLPIAPGSGWLIGTPVRDSGNTAKMNILSPRAATSPDLALKMTKDFGAITSQKRRGANLWPDFVIITDGWLGSVMVPGEDIEIINHDHCFLYIDVVGLNDLLCPEWLEKKSVGSACLQKVNVHVFMHVLSIVTQYSHQRIRNDSPTLPYALLIDVKSAAKPVAADLMLPPLS